MTIVLIILALSFLITIHEFGHFIAAKMRGIVVEEFGLGYPPRAITLFTWKGTAFSLNWIPFGGFVKMAGEDASPSKKSKPEKSSYYGASLTSRLIVLLAGAGVNFLFGALAFAVIFTKFGIPVEIQGVRIGYVAPGSPAAEVGIQANTEITAITIADETTAISTPADVIAAVTAHRGETVLLHTSGPCQETACPEIDLTFETYLRTEEETPAGEGSLGVQFQQSVQLFYPAWQMPFRGIAFGTKEAVNLGVTIVGLLGNMMSEMFSSGKLAPELSGPVGIVSQAKTMGVFTAGFFTALSFVAMLSINLAVMNVLPIPPLDGGKAVLTALESVISPKIIHRVEYYLSYGGYVALLGLIVIITIRDVVRLFSV
ncbi:MAG: hypothetical protein COY80_05195 [Candidatus Pacebacteria bacterium CG_4_10_14_0_8_um_filter_42_14]|nr:MAG: hypothetical protein COY80_05195 [Candidatus Pacebacteria bacterium CG_4_10_14_0_8_um_filter_42_14]